MFNFFANANYIMSITTNLKLNQSIIPCVPFIWYREQEMVCPIDYIKNISFDLAKKIFDIKEKINIDDSEQIYVIIQRNISDSNNLYVCLHSLLYYELHKPHGILNSNGNQYDNLLEVPHKFNMNEIFEIMIIPLGDSEIKEIPRGLQINKFTTGCVFIHDCAFSPPGCLHFNVNLEKQYNNLLCHIKCPKFNINMYSLFILFNDTKGTNIDDMIGNTITKFD